MQHSTNAKCKYSSIGRALDFHSKGCEFEPRYLLKFINRMNNSEENLQLLCPNCHSLTENFGSRNINCTRIDTRIR